MLKIVLVSVLVVGVLGVVTGISGALYEWRCDDEDAALDEAKGAALCLAVVLFSAWALT